MEYITIITPNEEPENAETLSSVFFLTGDMAKKSIQTHIPTKYFKYYYYGATIEVVDYENGRINDIRDVNNDDAASLGLGITYALTFNPATTESLATNGVVYILNQSVFFRNYPQVVMNTVRAMYNTRFALLYYTVNGGVVYVQLIPNPNPGSHADTYSMSFGFVTDKRDMLKSMLPKTISEFEDANRKLNQTDIDKLIDKLYRNGE